MSCCDKLKLNIGAGSTKIKGYKSVDADAGCKPDIHCNIVNGLPVEAKTVDTILFLHTIEHIQKRHHATILLEFHRVLIDSGRLVISYPEFSRIIQNWLDNKQGKREFWEATVYGCQRTLTDYHVSAMHTPEFLELLTEVGFKVIETKQERGEEYNTIIECVKSVPLPTYEDLIRDEVFGSV